MSGADKENKIAIRIPTNKLKKKTDEASVWSAFFFCINADPKPLSWTDCATAWKIANMPINPNSEGSNNLASMTEINS